jgi:hypothetical protein
MFTRVDLRHLSPRRARAAIARAITSRVRRDRDAYATPIAVERTRLRFRSATTPPRSSLTASRKSSIKLGTVREPTPRVRAASTFPYETRIAFTQAGRTVDRSRCESNPVGDPRTIASPARFGISTEGCVPREDQGGPL